MVLTLVHRICIGHSPSYLTCVAQRSLSRYSSVIGLQAIYDYDLASQEPQRLFNLPPIALLVVYTDPPPTVWLCRMIRRVPECGGAKTPSAAAERTEVEPFSLKKQIILRRACNNGKVSRVDTPLVKAIFTPFSAAEQHEFHQLFKDPKVCKVGRRMDHLAATLWYNHGYVLSNYHCLDQKPEVPERSLADQIERFYVITADIMRVVATGKTRGLQDLGVGTPPWEMSAVRVPSSVGDPFGPFMASILEEYKQIDSPSKSVMITELEDCSIAAVTRTWRLQYKRSLVLNPSPKLVSAREECIAALDAIGKLVKNVASITLLEQLLDELIRLNMAVERADQNQVT